MRPKASPLNLHIAAAFASAVTVHRGEDSKPIEKFLPVVKCKGPMSIFSALKVCIPDIVRLPDESESVLKGAVSEIELNKFLARSGYVSSRLRNRIKGTTDKWTKGFQRWKSIRWVDPRNPDELTQLRTKLAEIQALFPGPYSIYESQLLHFILNLQSVDDDCSSVPMYDTSMELDERSSPDASGSWHVDTIPSTHFVTHRR